MSKKGKGKKSRKQAEEMSADDLKQVAGGASDIFLKLGDIKGESQDHKHKDNLISSGSPLAPVIKLRRS
jgi:type VI protein secretion system component Hcp